MTKVRSHDIKSGRTIGDMPKGQAHREIEEAHREGKPQPHKHSHVGAILVDSDNNVLTSIRDFLAPVNADLIDKTLGGHVPAGYTTPAALLEVGNREFRIPTAVVNIEELTNIIMHHPVLLQRQAFLTHADTINNFSSRRDTQDGSYDEQCKQHVFIGAYDGKHKSSRGTAIRPMALEDLFQHAAQHPEKFSGDILHFADLYQRHIKRLISIIEESKNLDRSNFADELIESLSVESGGFVGLVKRKDAHVPIKRSYSAGRKQKNKHSHVGGILVGRDGQVYVQIRSDNKKENPGMYDKIVGGHIPEGDTPTVAAYHEFIEEMAIPIAIYGKGDYENILRNCPEAIDHQAICSEPVKVTNFESVRAVRGSKPFVEVCDQFFVCGYYGGSFEFTDKEATGVYQFDNRDALRAEMDKHPKKFTEDLKYMVKMYWDNIVPLNTPER